MTAPHAPAPAPTGLAADSLEEDGAQVIEALRSVLDPELGQDIVSLGLVREVALGEHSLRVTIVPTSAACPMGDVLTRDAKRALTEAMPQLEQIEVVLDRGAAPGSPGGLGSGGSPAALLAALPFAGVLRAVAPALLVALAMASLVAGLAGGLVRFGVAVPAPLAGGAAWHGALMVGGFLGTVIGLERAVALRGPLAWAAPVLSAAAVATLLAGEVAGAQLALVGAAVAFSGSVLGLALRSPSLDHQLGAAGGLAWLAGNIAWAVGQPLAVIAPMWAAFLVLTILGERVELGQLAGGQAPAAAPIWAAVGLLFTGAALVLTTGASAVVALPAALPVGLFAVGLAASVALVAVQDPAPRTLRSPGLPRYAAVALLAGYAWACLGAALWLAAGAALAGPLHDAALHAVFVGFVLGMVLGHAPIILPALLPVRVRFHPALHAPVLLFHGALLLRVVGDVAGRPELSRISSQGIVLALVFFAATLLSRVRLDRSPQASTLAG